MAYHEIGIADVVFDHTPSEDDHPTVCCSHGLAVQLPDV